MWKKTKRMKKSCSKEKNIEEKEEKTREMKKKCEKEAISESGRKDRRIKWRGGLRQ